MDNPPVVIPRSPSEAVDEFLRATSSTVVGGGTIAVPNLQAGRIRPHRSVLLGRAGMDVIERSAGLLTLGACVRLDQLSATPEPLASGAAAIADREIRAQATLGGNVCARSLPAAPRGDLRTPLVALDARVRVATAEGERTIPIEDFDTSDPGQQLVLAVDIDDVPRRAGSARLSRPHTHSYQPLHVSACAQIRAGRLTGVRVAAGGLFDDPVRLSPVERALEGRTDDDAEPAEAASRAAPEDEPRADALASAWYRRRILPTLVRRACAQMLGREERQR